MARTWLITGASRGLGRAFAEVALEAGDQVAATARDISSLDGLVEAFGERVLALTLDVTDREAVLAAVAATEERFGGLDVFVNNAGYGLSGGVEEAGEEQVRRQFEVNVFGALWATQAVVGAMRRSGGGHIFQISSIGGLVAFRNTGIYHATKWALEGLSESLAQEVESFGIRVTLVELGPFRTDWNGDSMERATPMPEYDDVLGQRREELSGALARTQAGDPRRAGAALLEVLDSDDPPLRLLLGGRAADLAPRAYRERLAEWERWEAVSRAADFPD
jgi:NAD(P)-dependent dehydrogenase (short-subunit alcohol dehydrogenase family)